MQQPQNLKAKAQQEGTDSTYTEVKQVCCVALFQNYTLSFPVCFYQKPILTRLFWLQDIYCQAPAKQLQIIHCNSKSACSSQGINACGEAVWVSDGLLQEAAARGMSRANSFMQERQRSVPSSSSAGRRPLQSKRGWAWGKTGCSK